MKKFLYKLITLAEIAIGAGLLLLGVTGFFSYFIFNALIGTIGFFVFIDALSRVDNPDKRYRLTPPPSDSENENEENKI